MTFRRSRNPSGESAIANSGAGRFFDGRVGKEIKIVFGMTTFHAPFRALGPGGTAIAPVWGPSFHGSSNRVRRPGSKWGAGFVFPAPGCWRIGVGSRGDVWIRIRS
jgi:hypothetical protein